MNNCLADLSRLIPSSYHKQVHVFVYWAVQKVSDLFFLANNHMRLASFGEGSVMHRPKYSRTGTSLEWRFVVTSSYISAE